MPPDNHPSPIMIDANMYPGQPPVTAKCDIVKGIPLVPFGKVAPYNTYSVYLLNMSTNMVLRVKIMHYQNVGMSVLNVVK